MNTTIQNMKIDDLKLAIIKTVSKQPFESFTVDKIKELIKNEKIKTNYATIHRKVEFLINQKVFSKSMYGMASQIKIDLNNETAISLLSLIETKKFELFFSRLKGDLSTSIHEITKDTINIPEVKCVLIFGSFAKGTQTKESDVDMLIIYEPSTFIPKERYEQYIKEIKSSIVSIIKVNEFRGRAKINPIVVSSEEHKEMIVNKEINVGTETLLNHILLKGYSDYWREIARCK
ncbi:MAG: nucleotidyltransferase domain-containing protein [Nanoarchaeota archaeon]